MPSTIKSSIANATISPAHRFICSRIYHRRRHIHCPRRRRHRPSSSPHSLSPSPSSSAGAFPRSRRRIVALVCGIVTKQIFLMVLPSCFILGSSRNCLPRMRVWRSAGAIVQSWCNNVADESTSERKATYVIYCDGSEQKTIKHLQPPWKIMGVYIRLECLQGAHSTLVARS